MFVPLNEFLISFVALFVIMDPFASVPVFLTITRRSSAYERMNAANRAASVAGAVLLLFMLAGPFLFQLMGITMEGFQIAGGLILLIVALSMVFGREVGRHSADLDAAVVIVAVPLITGPGALATATILSGTYGLPTVFLAAALSIVCVWVVLRSANRLNSVIGEKGFHVLSRIMGILLAAIAVEFMKKGIISIVSSAIVPGV
ncbi:MAG: MarC family protein [Candidatus Micrarchaeota archaeon]|nr:MarC family protein [Candidatus Micrarchaeota archaeon]